MLRIPVAGSQLLKEGYAILEVSQSGLVGKLLDVFKEACPEAVLSDSFYYSLMKDGKANRLLKERLKDMMAEEYAQWFLDCEVTVESFLCKPEGFREEMHLHQDWNNVDESKHWSLNLWLPLRDVDEGSGCLYVIPGSHLCFNVLRSGSYSTARIPRTEVSPSLVTPVPLKAGQAIVFHQALFHGSFANHSSPRPVMAAIIRPKGVPMMYFHGGDSETAEVYEISEASLFDELNDLNSGSRPKNCRLVKTIPYRHEEVSALRLNDHRLPM